MATPYTAEELAEFKAMVLRARSQDTLTRLGAVAAVPALVKRLGRCKCTTMLKVIEKEISDSPSTFRYIGDDVQLRDCTALGRKSIDEFRVQVDSFDHPWSHGWHLSPESDWVRV